MPGAKVDSPTERLRATPPKTHPEQAVYHMCHIGVPDRTRRVTAQPDSQNPYGVGRTEHRRRRCPRGPAANRAVRRTTAVKPTSTTSTHEVNTLTVPALAGTGTRRQSCDTLPVPTNTPNAVLIDAALVAHGNGKISDAAFRFYVADLRRLPPGASWALIDMAAAAEVPLNAATRLVAPLVSAGLFHTSRGSVRGRERTIYRATLPAGEVAR